MEPRRRWSDRMKFLSSNSPFLQSIGPLRVTDGNTCSWRFLDYRSIIEDFRFRLHQSDKLVYKRNLIMKGLLKKQTSDIENYASSEEHSRDYHKDVASSTSSDSIPHVSDSKSTFHSLIHKIDPNFARMIIAEMMGTFVLVFSICGIIGCTQLTRGEVGLIEYAATAGLSIIVIIFSIGPISCAHVNPAVTIAFAAFGEFPWSKVPFYLIAQLIGSLLATWIGGFTYSIKSDLLLTRPLQGCTAAFTVEFIATFIIMFLASALTRQATSVGHLSGFVVGIAIALAVLITGPVSGGSMNPARSIGPALLSWKLKDVWVYVVAPTAGGVAGALSFRVLCRQPQHCNPISSPLPSASGSRCFTSSCTLI